MTTTLSRDGTDILGDFVGLIYRMAYDLFRPMSLNAARGTHPSVGP